jgi:flagellar hook-associated protein 2
VQNFVKGYNDLSKTLQDATAFNPATKQGAILLGDSTIRLLQSQMRSVLNTPISNTGGSLTTLSQIGVTIQKDGTMAVDTSKLNTAIKDNPEDVARLFTTIGKSSDPLVSYSAAGTSTSAGSYPVNIKQHATQGSMGGCEEIESLIIESGENDGLNVVVDGVSASITLANGTYDYNTLAAEVQSKINGASPLSSAGVSVTVKHDQYGFIITSNSYGSKSSVDVSGSGALNLVGKTPVVTKGTDVAGTINGAPATGSGQTLTASDGAALGIKVTVNGGATGERGKVFYSQGYAHTLDNLLTAVLSKEGQIEARKKGINNSIKDIESHRNTLQQRMPLQEARFRKQYSTLETTLSNMSKTSNYLNQQLANLPRPY